MQVFTCDEEVTMSEVTMEGDEEASSVYAAFVTVREGVKETDVVSASTGGGIQITSGCL